MRNQKSGLASSPPSTGLEGVGVMRSGTAALMARRTTCRTMAPIRIQASSRMGRAGREPSVRYQWPQVIEVETAPIARVPARSASRTPGYPQTGGASMPARKATQMTPTTDPPMATMRPMGSQPMKTMKA